MIAALSVPEHCLSFYFVCDDGMTKLKFSVLCDYTPEDQWPVNAHLTPGPGIYFNAFIHVYSPWAGADNPLGTNVDANRKPLSLCPFVASFKTISTCFFHVFPHVYSPGQGQTNPWGQNFNVNRKALSF